MNAACEEHSAPIVQAGFPPGIFEKTFWGTEAVPACLYQGEGQGTGQRCQLWHLDVSQLLCSLLDDLWQVPSHFWQSGSSLYLLRSSNI